MTPIDFLTSYDHYNEPVGPRLEAMHCSVEITDGVDEYEILSYYLGDNGRMCLDIQKVSK